MALTKERFKIKRVFYKSMNFKDKYTTDEKLAGDPKEKDKIIVSNDAYLNAEMIQDLINIIDFVRLR